ncbi:uncharacterized protein [Dysidea avara]|uniref:uncharacterized protein n=1 Tax=Dysidea avara TaxID=196820 RepID=UPI0033295B97
MMTTLDGQLHEMFLVRLDIYCVDGMWIEKWETCHRHFKHGDTDTNMYLESFHNQLKTNYLNGKVNRRVDFLIHHLLEYEKDQFFRYKRDHLLPPPMHKRIQQELSHHQRGMKIPATKVKEINDGMWHVDSVSGNTPQEYMVVRSQAASCAECKSESRICTATECNCLCIHMYKCDSKCYAFNNGHICKHIHRIHSLSHIQPQDTTVEPTEEEPVGTGQQCVDADYVEPSIVYSESTHNPQKGMPIMKKRLKSFTSLKMTRMRKRNKKQQEWRQNHASYRKVKMTNNTYWVQIMKLNQNQSQVRSE